MDFPLQLMLCLKQLIYSAQKAGTNFNVKIMYNKLTATLNLLYENRLHGEYRIKIN
jgi:hypothetical protein